MSKLFYVLLILIIANNSFAKQKPVLIRSYCTIASAKRVATISTTTDSLFINYTPAVSSKFVSYPSVKSSRLAYQIIGQEEKDGYIVVYLKLPPFRFTKPHIPPIITISFSVLKDKLLVLQENGLRYETIKAAKADVASTRLLDKYFTTWYAEPDFKIVEHYLDFDSANKAAAQKTADNWINEFNNSKAKLQNMTSTFENYIYALDMWVKALVNNHFNPVTTLPDVYNSLIKYHIRIPSIRLSNTKEVQLHLDSTYSNNVHIDEPVRN